MSIEEFTVAAHDAGRADQVVQRRFPGTTRRLLAKFFADGQVLADNAVVRKGSYVGVGKVITLRSTPPTPADLRAVPTSDTVVDILVERRGFVAINKPPQTPSHPLRKGECGTAANALVARYPECADVGDDPREAGLVHRLDADTTGVLIAARDRASWEALRHSFSAGHVRKQYLALVAGDVSSAGHSREPIQRLDAFTEWAVDQRLGAFTLLRCTARTGRMHQVRIHLARAGIPIVGDRRYGGCTMLPGPLSGHFLHAARVALPDPSGGGLLEIEAPLPPQRAALLACTGTTRHD